MNLRWLTSFIEFNIDRVIPKPLGVSLARIFRLSTFIRYVVALVTDSLRFEEPARKV